MDLTSTFANLYPENSIGGECGIFAHNLIDFPAVGNSYSSKQWAVRQYGITAEFLRGNFHVGDVLITSEGTFLGFGSGHVAVVNSMNSTSLFLTESNFNKDDKVHHTRRIDRTSPKIFGVIRGAFKMPVEYPQPVQLSVTVFLNNMDWGQTMLGKLAELQNWFYQTSGQKLQLIINNPVPTKLSGWGYQMWGPGSNLEIMDKKFMDSQIAPLADSDIVLFIASNADWKKPSDVTVETKGYCWADGGKIKGYVVCDENEMSQYYALNAFIDYGRHEIVHGLYALGVDTDRFPFNTDLTHPRYYGQNGYPKDFDLVFGDLSFANLALSTKL